MIDIANNAQNRPSKQARYSRRKSAENAEIGTPELTAAQRSEGDRLREICRNSLESFNSMVFPNSSGLKPFGEVQLTSIAHDESVIVGGGRICKAEPRAYGKTTRTCNAALWGVLYGYRRMVPVFSANMEKSKNQVMLRWKTELQSNDLLYWMFPDLIWPLRALESKPQRCGGQTQYGELTHTQWTADRIVLPHIPGCVGSGSILIALPLKSCRGATHTTPDGIVLRPDLCIFDDVQKDEDADNPNTIKKIEELIDHTAMMLGGHSQTMSAIMNCTVRRLDDLSEQYLKKTSWRRVRYKMLTSPAVKEKEFWFDEYAKIRLAYNPEDPDDQTRARKESLNLYLSRRAEADDGASVTWPWAYAWADDDPLEVSAIQHAYNIRIDDGESVFASECQNDPLREAGGLELLSIDDICKKQSSYVRGQFPQECTTLTAFVDVHPSIMYWNVWAWQPGFTGYLIDFGTFPDQWRSHFRHDMLARRLEMLFPGRDTAATITAGLDALLHGFEADNWPGLMLKEFTRSDGASLKLTQVLIDANGEESKAIKGAIRRSQFSANLTPSYGKYIGARHRPMSQWVQMRTPDDGPEWVTTKIVPGEPIGIMFDANYWKTRFHRALILPPGSQGAIYMPMVDTTKLRTLAEHYRAERPAEVNVGSRVVYEFGEPRSDNHWYDCGVGAMVAASKAKITNTPPRRQKKRVTLAELAARAKK